METTQGPDRLVMVDAERDACHLERAVTGDEFLIRGGPGTLLCVPPTWTGVQADLFRADFRVCSDVEDVLLVVASDGECPALE